LNENVVQKIGLGNNLVDVKVCAIDEMWAGLSVLLYLGWTILAVALLFGTMARRTSKNKDTASKKPDGIWVRVVD
jgi:hypothetical protein